MVNLSSRLSSNWAALKPLVPTVGLYLLATFGLSSIFYTLAIISEKHGGGFRTFSLWALGIMYMPTVATLITLRVNNRSISELKWKWPDTNYVLLSWALPMTYTLVGYILVWTTGAGGFPNHEFMDSLVSRVGLGLSPVASTIIYVLLIGTFGMISSISSALGEEIGWRGFLIPELVKSFGFTESSVFVGLVWSIWHFPLIVGSSYSVSAAPWPYQLTCFTIYVISLSITFAWIRLKSGSLWSAAILHGSQNLYMQGIYTPLTYNTGNTDWYIDEFGFVLPVISVIVAIYFWRRRNELGLGVRLPV